MEQAKNPYIIGALGVVFGVVGTAFTADLYGTKKLHDVEHRLADAFVHDKILKIIPEFVPRQKQLVRDAKVFLIEHQSVLCKAQEKSLCRIDETHETALLEAIMEKLSEDSGNANLESDTKRLEEALRQQHEAQHPDITGNEKPQKILPGGDVTFSPKVQVFGL